MRFNKKKINKDKRIKKKMYLDKIVYIFLVIFIILCFYFHFNFLQTILLAIIFIIILFGLYLLEYKLKRNFLLNSNYSNKVDNLTIEELKEVIKKYYVSLEYKIIENQKYVVIEKNDKKYRLLFFLKELSIKDLKPVLNAKKEISGTVVITNCDISKEVRKFIKENKLFSITRPGLVDILKNIELYENMSKEKEEENEEEDSND